MNPGHHGYINGTNAASRPRTTLTPRQMEFLRAYAAADRSMSTAAIGRVIGVGKPTAYEYLKACIEIGHIDITGDLTDRGREAIV